MTTTKGNFSLAPSDALTAALARSYAAVHVEQGVPVLDRDLNLLGDLIAAALRRALALHVGAGVPGTIDFQIAANGAVDDFAISSGSCVVNGIDVTLAATTSYKAQLAASTTTTPFVANTLAAQLASPPLVPLTAPTAAQPNPRIDTVYLDVWQAEVDDSAAPAGDPSLGNPSDVGMRTSTRVQTSFVVRVNENASALPALPAGHSYYALAQLSRAAASVPVITDLRQTGLNVASLVLRLNALEALLAPVITSYSPEMVVAGQSVPITILGRNFEVGNVQVLLGPVPGAIDWTTSTNISLVVHVPYTAATGAADVTMALTVTSELGSAVAADPLTIIPPTPIAFDPSNPFTPTHAQAGAPITLNGGNFAGVNSVSFNTTPPVVVVPGSVSPTAITVSIPSQLPAGAAVTLTAFISGISAATATATTASAFTVDAPPLPPPPQFATSAPITPLTATRGSSITLAGTNFGTTSATTTVSFNGTPAVIAPASTVTVTPTSIQVIVPPTLVVPAVPNNTCSITVTVGSQSTTSSGANVLTVTPEVPKKPGSPVGNGNPVNEV